MGNKPDIKIRIKESFEHCESIAKEHYENFPVGSFLVPKDKRKYVWSIYAFARYADDIADSGELTSELKIQELDSLEDGLISFLKKVHPGDYPEKWKFLPALFQTTRDLNIPVIELTNLLKAFKQDSIKQRYDSFEELIEYSTYSANPIGHLVLYIFGYNPSEDGKLFVFSDSICTALQLTNFWQDVSVDLGIGRIYIPEQYMQKHYYPIENLIEMKEDEHFRALMEDLVNKTRRIFLHGKPLINSLNGRLKFEIKATYLGGNAILDKIESMNYKVLTKRVKIGKADKLSIILKTFLSNT